MAFLDTIFLDNTLYQWLSALITVIGLMIGQWLMQRIIIVRVRKVAKKTGNDIDDLILNLLDNTRTFLVFLVAVYLGSQLLELTEVPRKILQSIAIIAALWQVALWGNQLISYILERFVKGRSVEGDASSSTAFTALNFILRFALWVFIGLIALENVAKGQVTSLITGLGIGGIAVALAVQNILGDLFASLTIILDQPFAIGDFIVVDDDSGTVEHVGLKTTRIRTLNGEELIVGNSDLLGSRIRNFKKMEERRVSFTLGAAYETPHETLQKIPNMLEEIVSKHEKVRFDRAHLKSFGASTLDYEIVFYMLVPDYSVYMDVQQAINYEILERFTAQGIDLAYPTQTVLVRQS